MGAAAVSLVVASLLAWQTTVPDTPTVRPLDLAISSRTRLLVLAPHPDDEALGAAGLIAKTVRAGGAVHVVLLTSGDGFPEAVEVSRSIKNPRAADYRNFGVTRERETRAAMTLLGVRSSAVSFLGFPDEGLCLLASRYLYDKRRAFESPYTDRVRPPVTEQVVRGARYRGIDVRLELERIVDEFQPTVIALPPPDDDHPDHCSTHIFAREALEAVRFRPAHPELRVLHYLVHYGQWPLDLDPAATQLTPPAGFSSGQGQWVTLPLTEEEASLKQRALALYATQTQVIGRFMTAFARSNELYLEGEPRTLPPCWCDGENVAVESPSPRPQRR